MYKNAFDDDDCDVSFEKILVKMKRELTFHKITYTNVTVTKAV